MSERTILSSFLSEADAQQAAERIQALGVNVTQVDELHAFSGSPPPRRAFPISGKIAGLSSLTLNTVPLSRDASILLAADPSASGMADGADRVTGRNWLLTVVCPEELVDQAVAIIRESGGYT
ncbi:MAG: hypothetical protein K6T26_08120 [Alicyclobacillus sp.]|nr:hypothetical protein [Alicyclobacillus sp.]